MEEQRLKAEFKIGFEEACRPAIIWLAKHGNPKMTIIIGPSECILQEEVMSQFGTTRYWQPEPDQK